jgi:KDO2-lipid IV(A) lauroyltransferase
MAQQHFLFPKQLIEKFPALRKLGWWLESLVVKALLGLMRAMSPERATAFANFVFRNIRSVLPFTKKIRQNLTLAFPQKSAQEIAQLTRSVCGNLGNAAAELVFAERIWLERDDRIQFVMEGGVNLAEYRDKPAVLVTGHIGAWQISTMMASQYDLPLTSIFAPEKNPYLVSLFWQLRTALPCRWISRDGCMRGLTRELRQNRMVGLVSDTRLKSGDWMEFFGTPTPTNTTAARLALRYDCDLLIVRAERLPGMRFRLTVCPPIRPTSVDASTAEKVQQMTQDMLRYFETWIRDTPDQWMCFGRRWPKEAYGESKTSQL